MTIQVFNDLQCDPCSDWNRDVIVPLIHGPVRAGDVQLIFHHFPMTGVRVLPRLIRRGRRGEAGLRVAVHPALLRNQEEAKKHGATQDFLNDVARGVLNFNVEQWQRDMKDRTDIQQTLNDDESLAADRHLPAEPAVVVGGPNGTRQLIESPSLADVQAAIAEVR